MERFAAAANWNLELTHEKKIRTLKRKNEVEYTRLPIKTATGVCLQEPVVLQTHESSKGGSGDGEERRDNVSLEPLEKTPEWRRTVEAKEDLATIANAVNEDPGENIGMLSRMRSFIDDRNPTIRKLALLSLATVYKGIIPGYRIRPLSEEERKAKVSKDVKRLRNFEQAIVGGYKLYLDKLYEIQHNARETPLVSSVEVADVAIMCTCSLLASAPHFNFCGDLLKIVTEVLSLKRVDESFVKCRTALETLFENDEDGRASLEAVIGLTQMFKAKNYEIDESVLNTFLHLRLLSELDSKASEAMVGDSRKRKKEREFRTKKTRKLERERKAIEREMRETDAIVSHQQIEAIQSEILKKVFVTYLRILKGRPSALMGAALEGLARFAHLINLDFFGDILIALREMIEGTKGSEEQENIVRNATREMLLCVTTAFTLLEGQGEKMLNVDLTFFINHLYSTLMPLSLDADIEHSHRALRLPDPLLPQQPAPKVNVATEIGMLTRTLEALFFKSNASTNPLRVAAFAKRLMLASLNMPEKSALVTLRTIDRIGKKSHNKIASLFSTEEAIKDGIHRMDVDEPEQSNPGAATIWETVLLEKHYSPTVAKAAQAMRESFKD